MIRQNQDRIDYDEGRVRLTIGVALIVISALAILAFVLTGRPTRATAQSIATFATVENPCANTPGVSSMAGVDGKLYIVCKGLEASPIIVVNTRADL